MTKYSPCTEDGTPICEECDVPMHPFAHAGYAGWSCDDCGWSFDEEVPEPKVVAPKLKTKSKIKGFKCQPKTW